MKLTIITHVSHGFSNKNYFAYAPYVREMNIWTKFINEVTIVAPLEDRPSTAIDIKYDHKNIVFSHIQKMDLLNGKSIFQAMVDCPGNLWQIYKAMRSADHIHIRCPGNIGLLACLVQILFPHKIKTAKYAGNWDPNAKQPWSYRLQKLILSNVLLTKNMKVLVYGEWPSATKNIKAFFTASYKEEDKSVLTEKDLKDKISFIFAGTFSSGKRPLYAIKLIEGLFKAGFNVSLSLIGDGLEKENIEKYILDNNLMAIVHVKGNQTEETLKGTYKESHFVVLPSKSEGWPKVVAEGMFWGCVPITTNVSCLNFMLDGGSRGLLLNMNFEEDLIKVQSLLKNNAEYGRMSQQSSIWSRNYTLDLLEMEIKELINT